MRQILFVYPKVCTSSLCAFCAHVCYLLPNFIGLASFIFLFVVGLLFFTLLSFLFFLLLSSTFPPTYPHFSQITFSHTIYPSKSQSHIHFARILSLLLTGHTLNLKKKRTHNHLHSKNDTTTTTTTRKQG